MTVTMYFIWAIVLILAAAILDHISDFLSGRDLTKHMETLKRPNGFRREDFIRNFNRRKQVSVYKNNVVNQRIFVTIFDGCLFLVKSALFLQKIDFKLKTRFYFLFFG